MMGAEPQPRPLSGEILTAVRPARAAYAADDILDVEFVTLGEASPVEPSKPATAAVTAEPPPGLDMLRRADSRRHRFSAPGEYGFWLIGFTLVAASFWISGGHALVSR